MARDGDGRNTALRTDCPLQCAQRRGDNPQGGQPSAREQIDWAGLPVNLDLVFSIKQRDKVYVQHLMRKRENQLGRWLPHDTHRCPCEGGEHERVDPDGAESVSGH